VLIETQDLGYVYARGTPLERLALVGLSLAIRAGERVGVVGHTGSGKSTLVQLLAGLLAPTSGQVLLDGAPAHARAAAARRARQRMALAFQYPEDQIFELTVAREVAFGPRNLGLAAAEVDERVHWALEMVGLDSTFVARMPLNLSGGEMRRVALAGILAMRPEVLILDEPAAGLDPRGRRELLGRVLAWQQKTGATLIVVSHHLDDVARLADRVVLLDGGRLAADGPSRQVLANTALLRGANLAVPEAVVLMETLHQAGWDIRTDRLLVDEVVAEIQEVWADPARLCAEAKAMEGRR
jgi:energy-coupling factor transport system ATP-binding protein